MGRLRVPLQGVGMKMYDDYDKSYGLGLWVPSGFVAFWASYGLGGSGCRV